MCISHMEGSAATGNTLRRLRPWPALSCMPAALTWEAAFARMVSCSARAAAVAVWAAVRDGDRVAILRGSSQEAPVPPASGARGALRVLDALVRWYSAPPIEDAGLSVALDHAARLLRPGSRLIVLADARSIAAIPETRWPALAAHHEVVVLLLTDALENQPPAEKLPFSLGGERIELDLADPTQRQRWQEEFMQPVERALEALPRRGVRVYSLQGDAPSESWLPLLGRAQSQVA